MIAVVVGSPPRDARGQRGRAAADDRQRDAVFFSENVMFAAVVDAVVP